MVTFPVLHIKGSDIVGDFQKKVDAARASLLEESLAKDMNKQLGSYSKEIVVTGMPGIADTISIYNDNNIKAVMRFTDKIVLNYELAVPIEYIQSKINGAEINYNIQLNGTQGVVTTLSADGQYITNSSPPGSRIMRMVEVRATPETMNLITLNNATDFNGKYTLSK